MPTSNARIEANRRNAERSTGPKTEAGKSASRMNALKHGLAGSEDLLTIKDDVELVLERAEAFTRELKAPGAMGQLLAHRAALLSVRMMRSSVQEIASVAVAIENARDAFDQDRIDERVEWLEALEGDDLVAMARALKALEMSPEGLELMIATWSDLVRRMRAGDETADLRASLWFGEVEPRPRLALLDAISDEVGRLRCLLATSGDSLRANLDAARDEAGIIASFDPSPEACKARRYEAAAERGFYKALRSIRELRREAELAAESPAPGTFSPPVLPPPPWPTEPPRRPAPAPAQDHPPVAAPLGSFRAGVLADASPMTVELLDGSEAGIAPEPRRKNRPDLRKLASKRR